MLRHHEKDVTERRTAWKVIQRFFRLMDIPSAQRPRLLFIDRATYLRWRLTGIPSRKGAEIAVLYYDMCKMLGFNFELIQHWFNTEHAGQAPFLARKPIEWILEKGEEGLRDVHAYLESIHRR